MKNLDYFIRLNGSNASDKTAFLSLIQRDISGGRITRQEIDIIQQHPNVTEISISGLTQDTFEFFIGTYGHQFRAIIFWKCPLVGDLKMLETLDQVEYIVYFWNQRAEELWDFSKTRSLKGFCYDDFTRMHDISQIARSATLKELHFGNKVWTTYILNSLHPLRGCTSLKTLSFSPKKILDDRIEPISNLNKLERLNFPFRLFRTEQVAWLKAHLPNTIDSKVLRPFWTIEKPVRMSEKNKDTIIIGKRKPFLDSIQDRAKIEKYVKQFNDMYQWYLENPDAAPEDY